MWIGTHPRWEPRLGPFTVLRPVPVGPRPSGPTSVRDGRDTESKGGHPGLQTTPGAVGLGTDLGEDPVVRGTSPSSLGFYTSRIPHGECGGVTGDVPSARSRLRPERLVLGSVRRWSGDGPRRAGGKGGRREEKTIPGPSLPRTRTLNSLSGEVWT